MQTTSKKNDSLYTRVTPELKAQAETILDQLQLPMSTAVNLFLQQLVSQRKIPFETNLPDLPLNYDSLSKDTVNVAIRKGLTDGKRFSAAQIRAELIEDN